MRWLKRGHLGVSRFSTILLCWPISRILACHKGGLGSIPGKCSNAASGQCSWPFLDSAQGRRKINRQALSPRLGIEPRSPGPRVTGGDTIHYTNEELVLSLFRGRVESRKGVARRLLHGDLLSPWGHGCCKERLGLSTGAGYVSWFGTRAHHSDARA